MADGKKGKKRAQQGKTRSDRSETAGKVRGPSRGADRSRGKEAPGGVETPSQQFPANPFLLFLRALRAPFLVASALPVALGATLPFWLRPEGFSFSWPLFAESLLAILLLHAGANLLNDYYDSVTGVDSVNPHRSRYNGGSGIIQAGLLPAAAFLKAAIAFLVAGAALGVHLNAVTPGNHLIVIGIVGIVGGYFYSAPPFRLSYIGLGEVAVGLSLGVLPVLGSYLVQANVLSWRVAVASLPLTLAVVMLLWVNEIVDIEPDRAAGKRTLAVALGPRRAGRIFAPTLVALTYATLFLGVFTASMIPLALVAVLAFGLARTIVADLWRFHSRPSHLREAQSASLRFHLMIGAILAASPLVAIGH